MFGSSKGATASTIVGDRGPVVAVDGFLGDVR